MKRRMLITLICAAAVVWPHMPRAQQRRAIRVGWLTVTPNPQIESFRAGLHELGYVEGVNLTIDQRDAGGQVEWLGGLAVELGLLKPDAIVAIGFVAAGAVREVIKAIPIIFVSNDSIEQGFVDSLARPGGMMTGIELMGDDLSAKWLEFLKEVLPSLDRVGLLEALPAREGRKQALLAAAGSLGKKIVLKQVGRPDELPGAVEAIAAAGTQGMIVLPSALFHGAQKQVVGLAARHRLPAIYEHRDFVEAGGLMSYGPDIGTMFRRLADYIDRIVKGASPATMPVERPIKFELVVNLKTATSLGITVPESLLARADEVIE